MADHSHRASGRTTRRIVQYLRDLLAAPGVPLKIMDHFDNHNSHREVQHRVEHHLKFLGVDYVSDEHALTITVKPIRKKRK